MSISCEIIESRDPDNRWYRFTWDTGEMTINKNHFDRLSSKKRDLIYKMGFKEGKLPDGLHEKVRVSKKSRSK